MGWYIIMGSYIVNILIRGKPSYRGMFGLTKKYSFMSPPPKWREGKGDTFTSVVQRDTFN